MSDEQEQLFAEEAREQAILSLDGSSREQLSFSSQKHTTEVKAEPRDDASNESEPLLRGRQPYRRAPSSYDKAISEPWHGALGQNGLPWYKRPSIYWLLPAFFPLCVAFGGVIVPKTYLVLDLICADYLSDQAYKHPRFQYLPVVIGEANEQCRIPEVQALVSYFNTYSDLLTGIFSALIAPMLGSWSDRIGRKKVLIVVSSGMFVGEIVTIIVGRSRGAISVYWLLLGSLADGLSGSATAALAVTFAYASDTTAPEKRGVAFGYFHGILFSGIALGPIIAAWLIKLTHNILLPFYFTLGCHIFFIVFVTLFLPESLSKERQAIARETHAKHRAATSDLTWAQSVKKYNPFEPLWILRPKGEGSSPALRRNLVVLAAIDTLMFGVAMGSMRVLLISSQYRFDWSPIQASVFQSTANIVRVSGLVLLLPMLTRLFRGARAQSNGHNGSDRLDLTIIRIAILFDLLGYLGYALAPTGTFMFASGLIAAIGGIGSPTLSSSMTKHVPASMTGQLLGAAGLLHAIAKIVAPVASNMIYAETVSTYAGFVFLCLASIFVVVFLISWFLKPHVYFRDPAAVNDEDENDAVAGTT